MMMDSEEEEEQTALVCDNGKSSEIYKPIKPIRAYKSPWEIY